MTKADERMAKLREIGFIKSDPVNDIDYVLVNEHVTNGYVRNTKLYRRWIMAKTFELLSKGNWTKSFYNYYSYLPYQIKMMKEEFRVQEKLKEADLDAYHERNTFFNSKVVKEYLEHLNEVYKDQFETIRAHAITSSEPKMPKEFKFYNNTFKMNDEPDTFNWQEFYNSNTDTFDYENLFSNLEVFCKARNWFSDYRQHIEKYRINKAFTEAFKAAGSYYTLKNLIMFHGCRIKENDQFLNQSDSLEYLQKSSILSGYKLLAMLKKVIEDNNFSWKDQIKKIYEE